MTGPNPPSDLGDHLRGPYGEAQRIELPDGPEAAQTVGHWLITAPCWHPLWSQYVLACVRLDDDVPGFPAPYRRFVGATHELIVCALNPEYGVATPDSVLLPGGIHWLEPINIVEQFTATDDEMRAILPLAARAVVMGALNPETAGASSTVRAQWLTSIVRTLAHIRGEDHVP